MSDLTSEGPIGTRWVRHSRIKYVSMQVSCIVEIERVGVRWHIVLTNIFTGEVTNLETRSPLSVAIQIAELKADEIGNPNEREQ